MLVTKKSRSRSRSRGRSTDRNNNKPTLRNRSISRNKTQTRVNNNINNILQISKHLSNSLNSNSLNSNSLNSNSLNSNSLNSNSLNNLYLKIDQTGQNNTYINYKSLLLDNLQKIKNKKSKNNSNKKLISLNSNQKELKMYEGDAFRTNNLYECGYWPNELYDNISDKLDKTPFSNMDNILKNLKFDQYLLLLILISSYNYTRHNNTLSNKMCKMFYDQILKNKQNQNQNNTNLKVYNKVSEKTLSSGYTIKYNKSTIYSKQNIIFIVVGSTEFQDINDRIDFLIHELENINNFRNLRNRYTKKIKIVFSGYGGTDNMARGAWLNTNTNHGKIRNNWNKKIIELGLEHNVTEAQVMYKLFLNKLSYTDIRYIEFDIYCENFAIETVGNAVLSNILLTKYGNISSSNSTIIGISAWYHSFRVQYLLEKLFVNYDVYSPIINPTKLRNMKYAIGYWDYETSTAKSNNKIAHCNFLLKSIAETFYQTFTFPRSNQIYKNTNIDNMIALFLTNHGLYNDRTATTKILKKKIIEEKSNKRNQKDTKMNSHNIKLIEKINKFSTTQHDILSKKSIVINLPQSRNRFINR